MADDNQVQHYLIRRLVEDLLPSWDLISFKEGKSLLLDLETKTSEEQPSKILLDLQMQHMDGFEFLDHFQARLAQKFQHTRIIILSSSLRYDDRTRAMAYPVVQSYLVKPIDRETFYQEITK